MPPAPSSVQVVLGFDMETDIGSWTPYYTGLIEGTPRVLSLLARQGVAATFFFTGEAARTHPQVARAVANAGHEVGCHSLQHETLGDELFPIPGVRPVLPEEVQPRIALATRLVQEAVGQKMRSFRCPRLWGGTAVTSALEDLGYLADASYPLYFYKERLTPYRPSREDWTKPGKMRLLEIPNFADMTIQSTDPHGRDRDQWPLFRTQGAAALMKHVDAMLELYRQRALPAVICLYLHPWEFVQMPQGAISYGEGSVLPAPFLVQNCGEVGLRELGTAIEMLKERGAKFVTAGDLAQTWE